MNTAGLNMMKYSLLLILIGFTCFACNPKTKSDKPVKDSVLILETVKNENINDPLYTKWCQLIDSMETHGKSQLPKELHVFVEKGSKLNKDPKIYNKIAPLCIDGETVYFMEEINVYTAIIMFSFWRKANKSIFGTEDQYNYRDFWYQKKTSAFERGGELLDSADINNDPNKSYFSKKLIDACNRWDTKDLLTNHDLFGVSGDVYVYLAYKVVCNNNQSKVECVKVTDQGQPGDDISAPPYQIILDKSN